MQKTLIVLVFTGTPLIISILLKLCLSKERQSASLYRKFAPLSTKKPGRYDFTGYSIKEASLIETVHGPKAAYVSPGVCVNIKHR